MPTRVWLLRHAETAHPLTFHGAESDVALGERGLRQVHALAPLVAAWSPDAVVSSGLRRAVDTATPLAAACGLPPRVEPLLHERRVGTLSGTPTTAADGPWPDTLRRWIAGDTTASTPGAESFDAIHERVRPVWDRLAIEFAGRRYVVVCHGIVIRVLLLTLVPGWSVADWNVLGRVRNLAIAELRHDGATWELATPPTVPPEIDAVP